MGTLTFTGYSCRYCCLHDIRDGSSLSVRLEIVLNQAYTFQYKSR